LILWLCLLPIVYNSLSPVGDPVKETLQFAEGSQTTTRTAHPARRASYS
jgi:hypothetical protein